MSDDTKGGDQDLKAKVECALLLIITEAHFIEGDKSFCRV